jgi:cell division control protein CDC15
MDKHGNLKVADFGLATNLNLNKEKEEGNGNEMNTVGTPYWMAPEIITMHGDLSTACDVWSLGCTVIELLTGKPPYSDLLAYPAMFRVVEDEHPPLPHDITTSAQDFLLDCFIKEPTHRVDANTLLNHIWITSRAKNLKETQTINNRKNLSHKKSFNEDFFNNHCLFHDNLYKCNNSPNNN